MEKKGNNFRMTRRDLLQLLSFVLVVFFLMSFVENTSAQKPNFSGSWTYNQTKSDQPQGGGGGGRGFGGGGNLNVKQDGNNLTVDRIMNFQGEERTMTSKYTLDGKESVNTMGNRGGSSKSIAKWSADNKSLDIATNSSFQTQDGETRTMNSKQVWILTDGGKTLTITTTSPGRDGTERTRKVVYDKK